MSEKISSGTKTPKNMTHILVVQQVGLKTFWVLVWYRYSLIIYLHSVYKK